MNEKHSDAIKIQFDRTVHCRFLVLVVQPVMKFGAFGRSVVLAAVSGSNNIIKSEINITCSVRVTST